MEVCEPGWYQSQSEETLWNNTGAKGTELKQCIIHQTCWHLRLLCSGKEFSLHKRDQRGFSDAQGTQWGKRGHKHKYSEASSSLRQSQRTLESKDAHCKKSLANSYLRWSQRTANTGALLFSVRSFTRHLPTAGYAIKAKKWSGDFQRLNHWCSTWSNHHNIVLLRWFIQCSMSCRWEHNISLILCKMHFKNLLQCEVRDAGHTAKSTASDQSKASNDDPASVRQGR